jgi:chromosome partitioning protein
MLRIVVANLKGGTSKTTTAGYLAHVLYERDRQVLAVDADPQGSLLRWQSDADWAIPAVKLDTPKLHRNLAGITGDRFDAVVIDTPPLHPEIVASAFRVATHVVIPMAPTSADFERLEAVRDLLEDVAALRPDGESPLAAVLLTQAVSQAVATRVYRDLAGQHLPVFKTRVGFLQRFAQAVGAPIWDASATAYGDVLTELEAMSREHN